MGFAILTKSEEKGNPIIFVSLLAQALIQSISLVTRNNQGTTGYLISMRYNETFVVGPTICLFLFLIPASWVSRLSIGIFCVSSTISECLFLYNIEITNIYRFFLFVFQVICLYSFQLICKASTTW